MLRKQYCEAAVAVGYFNSGAGESVIDRFIQGIAITDFLDGLQRCREITSVMCQHRSSGTDLRVSSRPVSTCPELDVEPPRTHLFAQTQQLGCTLRIRHLGKHAFESCDLFRDRDPVSIRVAKFHDGPAPLGQYGGR